MATSDYSSKFIHLQFPLLIFSSFCWETPYLFTTKKTSHGSSRTFLVTSQVTLGLPSRSPPIQLLIFKMEAWSAGSQGCLVWRWQIYIYIVYIYIYRIYIYIVYIYTWWFIPLSKWVITPVSGLTLLIPCKSLGL